MRLHAAVGAAAAAALCFVPLFDVLGYESSLALAVLASLAGIHLGLDQVWQARRAGIGSVGDAADARPGRAVLGLWGRAALGAAAALVLPPLVLLLNGLRVRNCAPWSGLAFYAMLPLLSAGCAAGLGTAAGLIGGGRLVGAGLAAAGAAGSLGLTAWRFLSGPAIYAYDPLFGYFPGALYDEAVAIQPAFFWARLTQALLVVAGLLSCAALLDGRRVRVSPRRCRVGLLAGALLLWGAFGGLFHLRGELGVYRDTAAVQQALSGERRTAHFVLRFAPGGAAAREIDLIAREHEFQYQQLRAALGVEPDWAPRQPVVSYLFDSAARKQELMGAANTYIAKPWRREIYLQHEGWPHPVLKHELAHVFLGAAGDPVLRVARDGLIPQPGMIEGAAVAAEWRGGKLTPHQAVKALREARREPPLEAVLGLRFLTLPSVQAYTVAGSFCRYLLERRGPAPLLQVYRAGGSAAAFQRAYGQPLAVLAAEWSRFIDAQVVAPAEREVQREIARRPAVFRKVCAHELAVRRRQAWAAVGRGEADAALGLLESVCQDDPGEPAYVLEYARLLWDAGRPDAAAAAARRLLEHPARTGVLVGQALALLGDAAWVAGDEPAADARYAQAQAQPGDESAVRLLTAKRLALSAAAGSAGPLLRGALLDAPQSGRGGARADRANGHDHALVLIDLIEAERRAPRLGLVPYLLGRQLYSRGGLAEAAAALQRSLDLGLPDERFVGQARRLLGQALLRAEQPQRARAVFAQLLESLAPTDAGGRVELAEWIARCDQTGT